MKKGKFLLIVLVLATMTSVASAQSKIVKAQHGGIVEVAGNDLHIEMVKTDDVLNFYVLDAKGKTLADKTISGTVDFQFFSNVKTNTALETGAKKCIGGSQA